MDLLFGLNGNPSRMHGMKTCLARQNHFLHNPLQVPLFSGDTSDFYPGLTWLMEMKRIFQAICIREQWRVYIERVILSSSLRGDYRSICTLFLDYLYFCYYFLNILFFSGSIVDLQCFINFRHHFSSVTQSSQTFATPWTAAHQASLSIINSWSLLKLMSISQWCHPAISSSVCLILSPSIFPSIRVLSNESALCITWPKYWSFSFSISPSNEYSGLISFSIDWLDLLAVQGSLKSLPQHHSSKASILRCSAFFIV